MQMLSYLFRADPLSDLAGLNKGLLLKIIGTARNSAIAIAIYSTDLCFGDGFLKGILNSKIDQFGQFIGGPHIHFLYLLP